MTERIHGYPSPVQIYPGVTRVTIVGPDGIAFERFGLYPDGCEIHLQDNGRTLKVFPRQKLERSDDDGTTNSAGVA